MNKHDFSFEFPQELIASYPSTIRHASRLLCVPAKSMWHDGVFTEILDLLKPHDLLILNDSKVIAARLLANKLSGGEIEILIERISSDSTAQVQIKASKTPKVASYLRIGDTYLKVVSRERNLFTLQLGKPPDNVMQCAHQQDIKGKAITNFNDLLKVYGKIPLPPYIRRDSEVLDKERYQTVYARHSGSVAAPTAGLHFDEELLNQLKQKGIMIETLTLHIGSGTFQPIREKQLSKHKMHRERFFISDRLCDAVAQCRKSGGRIVAVGTTTLRALESAAQGATDQNRPLSPFTGETDLFIRPGYQFCIVDVLLTNFHLPESTLFILVCAFAGKQKMLDVYAHAIAQAYQLFSYGDACWLEKKDGV